MLNSNCYHMESCKLYQENNHFIKYVAGNAISIASAENV